MFHSLNHFTRGAWGVDAAGLKMVCRYTVGAVEIARVAALALFSG